MKLKTAIQADEFMKIVESCQGNVYLRSSEGDVFNLKSSLSIYIAIGRLLDKHVDDLELFCDFKGDESKFFKFFIANPEVV